MSYIAKNIIGGDERLIGIARLHKIYLIAGAFWGAVCIGIGFAIYRFAAVDTIPDMKIMGHNLGTMPDWILGIFTATGFFIFLVNLINVIAIELALTTRRVIYKRGLIMVEVEQIELDEIEGERVHHGVLGSLLNYGAITLDCRFINDIRLPAIRNPYKFIRALHKERSHLVGAHPVNPPV